MKSGKDDDNADEHDAEDIAPAANEESKNTDCDQIKYVNKKSFKGGSDTHSIQKTDGNSDSESVYGMSASSPTSSRRSTTCPSDNEFIDEWDDWSEVERGTGPMASWESIEYLEELRGNDDEKIASVAQFIKQSGNNMGSTERFPLMPCIPSCEQRHRDLVTGDTTVMGFNAAVSRPVGRKEMMNDPEAYAPMQKEWKGQRDSGVYDTANRVDANLVTAAQIAQKLIEGVVVVFNRNAVEDVTPFLHGFLSKLNLPVLVYVLNYYLPQIATSTEWDEDRYRRVCMDANDRATTNDVIPH